MKGKGRRHYFGIIIGRDSKADRDSQSGILRRIGENPDVQAIIISPRQLRDKARLSSTAEWKRADGFITTRNEIAALKSRLRNARPVVCIDLLPTDSIKVRASVSVDDVEVARRGADLLIRRGYASLAFVGSPLEAERQRSKMRAEAFCAHARTCGLACSSYEPPPGSEGHSLDEIPRLAKFLQTLKKPCGLMLFADNCAQLVLDACRYAHLTVPGHLASLGVDDEMDLCENLRPTLSSILPDFENAGYLAAAQLEELLDKGGRALQPHITYGVRSVIERESTQDVRGGGYLVARAREIIHKNVHHRLTTGDLAAALNVSRRLLELRFREILGCGVHEEVTRVRMEMAERELTTTRKSVTDVSAYCGYATDIAFRKAFKARTGLSPKAWRQRQSVTLGSRRASPPPAIPPR